MTNEIHITVTQGNLNNNYMSVAGNEWFFPQDSFGGNNSRHQGREISLKVSGLPDVVLTDIAGDKKVFRRRGWCAKFFRIHNVKAGARLTIRRIADYEYEVYP